MKAFQLKVMIKNSKPPIWRRIVVPAGITFSQLSIILNKSMGWCGYHLFEFEFYHLNLHILDGIEDDDFSYHLYNYMEASTTYVREFLEDNAWFTYTYDLGDNWEHRVTVEKIIEDYEYNYPIVLKYKGDCPVEDCGGIYGYYEKLDIISNETHPEYEEISDWMDMQGYPEEYDMEFVNEELKEQCFYRWGAGETRGKHALYDDMFNGKVGLNATKNDKNVHNYNKCEQSEGYTRKNSDLTKRFEEIKELERIIDELLQKNSLVDIFSDFNKDIIVEIAKEKGLKKISQCNKRELIERLVSHMLKPEIAREYFVWLNDDEIKEFEKAANVKGLYIADDEESIRKLYEAAYIGMLEDDEVSVTKDVYNLYVTFKGAAFEEERKKKSYLYSCLQTISFLYGIAPMSVLLQLMAKNPKLSMTQTEIINALHSMPFEYKKWILDEGVLYSKEYYPDDRGLLRAQGDKEFYIPTYKDIVYYGHNKQEKDNAQSKRLKDFMVAKMGASYDEADKACMLLRLNMSVDVRIDEHFRVLDGMGLYIQNESQINELVECIMELENNTRKLSNRGYTPNEMHAKYDNTLLKKDKVINFVQAKKSKIYPNDLCPCGSGKKYKNCCKRK